MVAIVRIALVVIDCRRLKDLNRIGASELIPEASLRRENLNCASKRRAHNCRRKALVMWIAQVIVD